MSLAFVFVAIFASFMLLFAVVWFRRPSEGPDQSQFAPSSSVREEPNMRVLCVGHDPEPLSAVGIRAEGSRADVDAIELALRDKVFSHMTIGEVPPELAEAAAAAARRAGVVPVSLDAEPSEWAEWRVPKEYANDPADRRAIAALKQLNRY